MTRETRHYLRTNGNLGKKRESCHERESSAQPQGQHFQLIKKKKKLRKTNKRNHKKKKKKRMKMQRRGYTIKNY